MNAEILKGKWLADAKVSRRWARQQWIWIALNATCVAYDVKMVIYATSGSSAWAPIGLASFGLFGVYIGLKYRQRMLRYEAWEMWHYRHAEELLQAEGLAAQVFERQDIQALKELRELEQRMLADHPGHPLWTQS